MYVYNNFFSKAYAYTSLVVVFGGKRKLVYLITAGEWNFSDESASWQRFMIELKRIKELEKRAGALGPASTQAEGNENAINWVCRTSRSFELLSKIKTKLKPNTAQI